MKHDKPKKRNSFALAALSRKSGGPMKHRLEPKKGAKNDQPDLIKEIEEVRDLYYPEFCPTCKEPYSQVPTKRASYCSNGFHCCRNCIWKNGKVIQRCDGYHIGDICYPTDNE